MHRKYTSSPHPYPHSSRPILMQFTPTIHPTPPPTPSMLTLCKGRYLRPIGALKGQCPEIFDTFFYQKFHQAKTVSRNFSFQPIYICKNVCPHSQRLRGHCVSVVNDYENTVSAQSMIRGHVSSQSTTRTHVRIVNDYADTRSVDRSNIFAKTKKFAKPCTPLHMGPSQSLESFKQKNGRKSRDTVPLFLTAKLKVEI